MKKIIKSLLIITVLLDYSITFADDDLTWREEPAIKLGNHKLRYALMNHGNSCDNYTNIGVVLLHGSTPDVTWDTGGAYSVAIRSNRERSLKPLSQWLRNHCVRFVAPDSGLKYSLKNNKYDYKRWDSDNALGGFERKLIIQLMDKMVREQGVTELYLMGYSSGSMMTHNVAQELINHPGGINLRVKQALKGIVMADGVSANQTHNLDYRFINVKDDVNWWNYWFITDINEITSDPINIDLTCSSRSKLISTTEFAREHGIYINGRDNINGLEGDKKWDIPTLIINSKKDKVINVCLKNNFAQAMKNVGVYIGSEFGYSVRVINGINSIHDSSIWARGFNEITEALVDAHNSK